MPFNDKPLAPATGGVAQSGDAAPDRRRHDAQALAAPGAARRPVSARRTGAAVIAALDRAAILAPPGPVPVGAARPAGGGVVVCGCDHAPDASARARP